MADVTVHDSTKTSLHHTEAQWGPYWASPTTGYIIMYESTPALAVYKTSDSGATWAEVDSANHKTTSGSFSGTDVWFEPDTPGDSGTKLHMAWLEYTTNVCQYAAFDTSTDSWGSTVEIANSLTISSLVYQTEVGITKTVGGILLVVARPVQSPLSNNHKTYRSTDGGATWANANNRNALIGFKLFPANLADTDDIWMVTRAASVLNLHTWDNSASTWSAGTQIDANAGNGYPGSGFTGQHTWLQASIRLSDGLMYLAAWNNFVAANSDIQTWEINGEASITARANVLTDIGLNDSYLLALTLDQQSGDLYAAYAGKEDGSEAWGGSVSAWYKKSTDGMVSWGSEQAYGALVDDLRTLSSGPSINSNGGRWMPAFYNDDLNDVLVNDGNDVQVSAAPADSSRRPRPYLSRKIHYRQNYEL